MNCASCCLKSTSEANYVGMSPGISIIERPFHRVKKRSCQVECLGPTLPLTPEKNTENWVISDEPCHSNIEAWIDWLIDWLIESSNPLTDSLLIDWVIKRFSTAMYRTNQNNFNDKTSSRASDWLINLGIKSIDQLTTVLRYEGRIAESINRPQNRRHTESTEEQFVI